MKPFLQTTIQSVLSVVLTLLWLQSIAAPAQVHAADAGIQRALERIAAALEAANRRSCK